ncbi:unnamed protein product [Tenebrio molitor]|nr:unnamed protein product [Tenebrio molitor]
MSKTVKQFYFLFFPHFEIVPKFFYACLTNCVCVFRETGSVTHKKDAGRPIVRTEDLFIDGHFEVILCFCQFDNF